MLQDRTLGIDGGQVLGVIEGYCASTAQHIVHLLFLFTLSPFFIFYLAIMFMAGAKTASPAELKRPQYAPTKDPFIPLYHRWRLYEVHR